MILFHSKEEVKKQQSKGTFSFCLQLHPVEELILRDRPGKIHSKGFSRIVRECIHKYLRKMGKGDLTKLTFENICFEDPSTKVKISFIPNLKTLVLKSCSFSPRLQSTLLSIEIEDQEKTLTSFLVKLKQICPRAIQTCLRLQYIKTSELKIGCREFCIKLDTKILQTDMKKYFGTTLSGCSEELALAILDHSIAKILNGVQCSFRDYEHANEVERKAILKGLCYGLCKSDPNLYVYPAICHDKNKGIVLVCYMKENFDTDRECTWGEYRGFKTFWKSYYHVSPESVGKTYPEENLDELKVYFENHSKNIDETIREHSADLMKRHSNLEIIGLSFQNNNEKRDGHSDKPRIALYVRLKSFVPYGESLFPSELAHPSDKEIVFKTDVREGYFMHIADSAAHTSNPLMKLHNLSMGCSIGFRGNTNDASLGPFVDYEYGQQNEIKTGFLTVCHLFTLPTNCRQIIGTEVVQPSEKDVFVDPRWPQQETNTSSVCGHVIACSYTNEVDASLVHITDRGPCTGSFCYRKGDFRDAGFSEDTVPKYTDGSSVDIRQCVGKQLVRFGKTTFLTSGQCLLQSSAVRLSDVSLVVECPTSGVLHNQFMINQFQIRSSSRKSFCDLGDSGAGVFLVNDDKSLTCVGIVIGKTKPDDNCVATPIKAVLDSLSKEHGHPVTLTTFTEDA